MSGAMKSIGYNSVRSYSSAECDVDIFFLSDSIPVSHKRPQSELRLNMNMKLVLFELIQVSQIALLAFTFFLLRRQLDWSAIKKK